MKHHKIYLLLFTLLVVSCNNALDIEPQQALSSDIALRDQASIERALIGAFDALADNDVWGGGQYLSDLYADNGDLIWTGSFSEPEQIFQKNILVNNAAVANAWAEAYEAINIANNVLSVLEILTPDVKNLIEGNALFVRGAAYFELINLFAKAYVDGDPTINLGVPLSLTATQGLDDLSIPRATVEEVYNQIISDLQRGKETLLGDFSYFTTSEACSAILMRAYLNQGNYQAALDEANFVINSNYYILEGINEVYNQRDDTGEDIFAIQITSQDGVNDFITFYAAPENGGRGDITVSEQHFAKYRFNDARRTALFYQDDNFIRRTAKWQENASQDGNIPITRLAEIYLTRAECHLQLGNTDLAALDLNTVRRRVNLPDITNPTLEDILFERSLELAFEGHLFRDVKRTRRNFTDDIAFDDERMVYPIPQREMDVNGLLVQNGGY